METLTESGPFTPLKFIIKTFQTLLQQPAAETSYQQPVSTGNLYYYYYPVAAYPLDEKNDSDELDPLVLVLLPVTIIVGLLALLSIFSKSPLALSNIKKTPRV